jgi:DNA replication initiation complex subunit (GINS family)
MQNGHVASSGNKEIRPMITKEQLKLEIEKVPDEYIDALYKIIRALEKQEGQVPGKDWFDFISQTYGCMQDSPIKRGNQGAFDMRGEIG